LFDNRLCLLGVFSMLDQHLGTSRRKPERSGPDYTLKRAGNEHRFA
jgi:hypothetical protein